jgi:Trk K+ transport system NAD-binding subunit
VPTDPSRRVRRAVAEAWFLLRALRGLRRPLLSIVLLLAVGAWIEHRYGAIAGQPGLDWASSTFQAWRLITGEAADFLPVHPAGQAVVYLFPVLGFLFFAEGLLKLGVSVFDKSHHAEAWVSILAGTSRQHILLCGLGTVGFRILEELVGLGIQVFVVERDEHSAFVSQARSLGAEVLIGDARADDVLRSLNITHARAVIVATNDDLANLEIAMDVRDMRADIPIIMRLYDQRLAQKVKGALGVQVSVSTSKLAAPLFASVALDTSVVGTHRVGGDLMVVMELDVEAGSQLAGRTVQEIGTGHGVLVVAVRDPAGAWTLQPRGDDRLAAGGAVQLMVRGPRAAEIRALTSAA